MRLARPISSALALALAAAGPLLAQVPPAPQVILSSSPEFTVACERPVDVDGDGTHELLIIGEQGEVRILDPASGKWHGSLVLPHPDRSLLAVAALDGEGAPQRLVVLSADGLWAYAFTEACFAGPPVRLVARARLGFRVGRPQFATIAQDVNGDRRPDLVVPGSSDCTLYLNTREPAADGSTETRFTLASRFPLQVSATTSTRSEPLSRRLENRISIPQLRTRDLNGDGRQDLVAQVADRHHYHLQGEGGAFPEQPDAVLDLARFRDTTPNAGLEFGQTLAPDTALLHSEDLDGDGIPDYVIAHRRKIWVYHGSGKGPRFDQPSKILLLAEDVSFLMLMPLDDDRYPDLVVFKVQVPTLATLLLGFFAEWEIGIQSIGYANEGGRTFAKAPRWRRETVFRLPPLANLLGDAEAIVARFRAVGARFQRQTATGDLDGDGAADLLVQAEDRRSLEFWLRAGADSARALTDQHARFREFLFGGEDRVWDLDRVLAFLRSQADDSLARQTADRPAAGAVPLRDPEKFRLESLTAADLDGDGRSECVLHYRAIDASRRSTFDLLAVPR